MKQGKAQDATDELASYLRRDPYDVAARQTYLILLYEQGRYSETACEATSLLKDESQNASVLVYRALANSVSDRPLGRSWTFAMPRQTCRPHGAQRVFAANSEIDLLIRNGNFARRKGRARDCARSG